MSAEETLVNDIVTAYGVQPFKVEQVLDQYGIEYLTVAFAEVQALPFPPASPLGWMISQLRSGRIQAETNTAAKNATKTDGFAAKYCAAQHSGRGTAATRLAAKPIRDPELRALLGDDDEDGAICSVCGKAAAL